MIENFVAPISKVTARDLLKAELIREGLPQEIPTREGAELWAADLMKKNGGYIRPDFLLDVWLELFRR